MAGAYGLLDRGRSRTLKYGAEILLDDLIVRLSADYPWRDEPRGNGCAARFVDLPPHRSPDMPTARRLRVISGSKV